MRIHKFLMAISLFFWLLSMTACSDIKLGAISPKGPQVESLGTFCTKDPDELNRFTKFLFVMDKSGSNSTTDPNNVKRAGNIERYYNSKKNDPNIKWGMIRFSGNKNGVRALIYDTDPNKAIFTQDEGLVNDGLNRLREEDLDATPYDGALGFTKQTIKQDMEEHPEEDSFYIVFFITDGAPTSPTLPGGKDSILGMVDDIVSVKPGSVMLSTAFYGPDYPMGEDLLQEMANRGGGKYINFNNTDEIDFDNLIVAPGKEPWRLKNFIVYNTNSAICEDQYYGMDSDGDGVCDKDEIKYGLNPQKRSTYDDGYSDFFWFLVKTNQIAPGNLTGCPDSKRIDDDMDLLNDCEEAIMRNMNPSGTKRRSADPKDPDTDNDGIIDGLETVIFRNMLGAPLNNQDVLMDLNGMGVNAYTQIFQHKNPLYPNRNAPSYDTYVEFSHFTDKGQSCYTFRQKNLQLYRTLPVAGSGTLPYQMGHDSFINRVLVYFIQTKSTDPNGKGIYMYSFQDLKGDAAYDGTLGTAAGLVVKDGIFTPYAIPKPIN